jgi:cytosine deaminase
MARRSRRAYNRRAVGVDAAARFSIDTMLGGRVSLIVRNARVAGFEAPVDIAVQDHRIARIGPSLPERAEIEIDADGGLTTPALVEPHLHLDAVLTEGQPRHNRSGTLFEGIEIWGERVARLTVDDITRRAGTALRWLLAHGVTRLRAHVDVCDPSLTAVRGLLAVREAWRDTIDIQLVAFPQQGIYSFPDGEKLMIEALELGVDVVGGIPHYEWTREYGERDVKTALALAARFGRRADLHCDETDDDHSRFLEVLAAETIRLGLQGRVTASHANALHSYNNAYADRLIRLVRAARLNVVTNPLDSSVLQGRFDSYPIRRGYTRVKELLRAGVNVAIGHDSIMDPWYPLGVGDPVQACFVMVHYGQMSGHEELTGLLDFVTTRAAHCLGVDDYGLAEGRRADLVVFDAPTPIDAIRTLAPRRAVIARGKLVARTAPRQTTVTVHGQETAVSFLR